MPTYDYKCTKCGHTFETFQSMKDGHLKKCPKCGKNALERLIGVGAAVLFKGSGFYQTDYRSESYKKSAEADKKPAATGDSTTPAKAETKAETKSETKSESTKDATPPKAESSPKPEKKPGSKKKSSD